MTEKVKATRSGVNGAGSVRLGLVEVGSRAVRYLVADFGRAGSFAPVTIRTVLHKIDPSNIKRNEVADLNAIVEAIATDMKGHKCDKTFVYGTEICRRIHKQYPEILHWSIKPLSPVDEARGSWAAGFLCRPDKLKAVHCTVIDEGNGSTEIASAYWDGMKIREFDSISLNIGSALLASMFEDDPAEYIENLKAMLDGIKDRLRPLNCQEEGESAIYIGGGVATKAAWLKLRRNIDDHYKPELINGARMKVQDLIEIYNQIGKLYISDRRKAVALVDNRSGSETEAVRLIASAPFLALLKVNLDNKASLSVTGYGLRHGIGFLLRNGLV